MKFETRKQFLISSFTFELSLVLIAYLLAFWARVDPVDSFQWDARAALKGVLYTLPLLGIFVVTYGIAPGPFRDIKEFLVLTMGPALHRCRWYDLLMLGILAGVTEEILFRGLFQVWISEWHPTAGLVLSNVLFGIAHIITLFYGLVAFLMGLYLGFLFNGTGETNLLIPIVTHAFYDFIAFLVVVHTYRKRLASGEIPAETPPRDRDLDSEGEFRF